MALLARYYLGEPAHKSKNYYQGVKDPAIMKHITEVLTYGVSIQARDKNADNKLVGIRTSYIIERRGKCLIMPT